MLMERKMENVNRRQEVEKFKGPDFAGEPRQTLSEIDRIERYINYVF
jgi:hypothetical protein